MYQMSGYFPSGESERGRRVIGIKLASFFLLLYVKAHIVEGENNG